MKIKIIAIILILIMVANLILLVLNKINPILFWIITIVIALMAYKGIPLLRKTFK